jgi:hypothetical protein
MFRFVLLAVVATAIASCDRQVGMPPSWQALGLPNTQVTNPQGGGPQVVQWGPADANIPERNR